MRKITLLWFPIVGLLLTLVCMFFGDDGSVLYALFVALICFSPARKKWFWKRRLATLTIACLPLLAIVLEMYFNTKLLTYLFQFLIYLLGISFFYLDIKRNHLNYERLKNEDLDYFKNTKIQNEFKGSKCARTLYLGVLRDEDEKTYTEVQNNFHKQGYRWYQFFPETETILGRLFFNDFKVLISFCH